MAQQANAALKQAPEASRFLNAVNKMVRLGKKAGFELSAMHPEKLAEVRGALNEERVPKDFFKGLELGELGKAVESAQETNKCRGDGKAFNFVLNLVTDYYIRQTNEFNRKPLHSL